MTTIAFALPPIFFAVCARKCSTTISARWARLCGCSVTKRAIARRALRLVVLRILGDRLLDPEVRLVGRVVREHVEDEALVDRLPHRVEVEGPVAQALGRLDWRAEQLERLRLRRGREREEREVPRPAAARKRAREQVLPVAALGLLGRLLGLSRSRARASARRRSAAASPVCDECASSTITA